MRLRQACARTLRATVVLHNIASTASRPCIASKRRSKIHSEMSKLLFPVIASMPRRLAEFRFSGRFALFRQPNSAFVTQGGLPRTRTGAGSASRSRWISSRKKSASSKLTLLPSLRRLIACRRAQSRWGLISTATTLSASGNASSAESTNVPSPHVGSTIDRGETPKLTSSLQTLTVRDFGVWKSPNAARRPLFRLALGMVSPNAEDSVYIAGR